MTLSLLEDSAMCDIGRCLAIWLSFIIIVILILIWDSVSIPYRHHIVILC
jgi:hypothetical protein